MHLIIPAVGQWTTTDHKKLNLHFFGCLWLVNFYLLQTGHKNPRANLFKKFFITP